MRRVAFLLLLAVVCSTRAVGQRQASSSIELAGVALTLGAPRDAVLTKFGPEYELEKVGESILVRDKRQYASGVVYGVLGFTGGKLSYVSKRWNVTGSMEPDMARALYGVLSQFRREHRIDCYIGTGEGTPVNPMNEIKDAYITCGDKYIDIGYTKTEQGESGSVDEVLGSPK